jgi:predicted dehydrogenase
LSQANLDFVDICTRPYSHSALIRKAAGYGLPVLCQKPFCSSLEEAQEMVEFCRQAGIRLMINENFRWQAWYRKAKELLDSGALGKPFYTGVRWRLRTSLPEFHHPQAYFAEMPRWALYELGVHYLDTFRFLFGEPQTVFARLHKVSPYVQGEDVELITVSYKDLTCLIDHSFASVPIPGLDRLNVNEDPWQVAHGLEIDATHGTLLLKPDRSLHLFTDNDQQEWQFPADSKHHSHVAAQKHFIDCLESGCEFETSGGETLKTMALVWACYRSAEEGRVVDPREMSNQGWLQR